MSASTARFTPWSFTARAPRVSPAVLALTVIALAMILPVVHVWLHGADSLIATYVAQRKASGSLPPRFLYVAGQVAQNRVDFAPIIDAIKTALIMAGLTASVWVFARWRMARLSLGTSLAAVSFALLAEFAFYIALYLCVWAFFGSDGMKLDWRNLVPTNLARVVAPGWERTVLANLGLGVIVRFAVLGTALRRSAPTLSDRSEWLVAGCASLTVVAANILTATL